ncbi:hypothetical protein J6396_32635, partial [Pseudomonas aeruginosa]|nr:hypothetical protein [Pseudomonas aeruginosa]
QVLHQHAIHIQQQQIDPHRPSMPSRWMRGNPGVRVRQTVADAATGGCLEWRLNPQEMQR